MHDIELLAKVLDFIERGGDVLLVIAAVTALMWTFIIERTWYFLMVYPAQRKKVIEDWNARSDHSSWTAHQIRRLIISEVQLDLENGLGLVKALVAVCPMLGLLGTVTGMIEVFDVMANAGSGNARGMASGVSKATLPTMAGMVAALSGLIISVRLDRYASEQADHVADTLEVIHD
jgi:biopolymer transport protein ExbB